MRTVIVLNNSLDFMWCFMHLGRSHLSRLGVCIWISKEESLCRLVCKQLTYGSLLVKVGAFHAYPRFFHMDFYPTSSQILSQSACQRALFTFSLYLQKHLTKGLFRRRYICAVSVADVFLLTFLLSVMQRMADERAAKAGELEQKVALLEVWSGVTL